jgi:hypothetical protein
MAGRIGAFGKVCDEGDGNVVERMGCGACIGDRGCMKEEPGDDAK